MRLINQACDLLQLSLPTIQSIKFSPCSPATRLPTKPRPANGNVAWKALASTQLRVIAPFEVSLSRQSGLLSVGLIQEEASQGATGRMRPI